ncbi:hypothetical protein AEGHOMDF_0059 [Methylobacterium soli]|nr:hypothetical protein AEGHOMDF_0059 [Methylobacterium soli]
MGSRDDEAQDAGADKERRPAPVPLAQEQGEPEGGGRHRPAGDPDRQADAGREGGRGDQHGDPGGTAGLSPVEPVLARARQRQQPEPRREEPGDVVGDPEERGAPPRHLLVQRAGIGDPEAEDVPRVEGEQGREAGGRKQRRERGAGMAGCRPPDEAGLGEEEVEEAVEADSDPDRQSEEGRARIDQGPAEPVHQGRQRVEEIVVADPALAGEERVHGGRPRLEDRPRRRRVLDEVDDHEGLVDPARHVDIDRDADHQDDPGEDQQPRHGVDPPRPAPPEDEREARERQDEVCGARGLQPEEAREGAVEERQQAEPEQGGEEPAAPKRDRVAVEQAARGGQRVAGQQDERDAHQERRQDPDCVCCAAVHRFAANGGPSGATTPRLTIRLGGSERGGPDQAGNIARAASTTASMRAWCTMWPMPGSRSSRAPGIRRAAFAACRWGFTTRSASPARMWTGARQVA